MTEPITPTIGTDNYRMLVALIAAAPDFAWNLDKGLGIKANSRAHNLRQRGWRIEWKPRTRPGSRKRDSGYRLLNPPTGGVEAAA